MTVDDYVEPPSAAPDGTFTTSNPNEAAFQDLMRRHPEAIVTAVDAMTSSVLVGVPEELAVPRSQVVEGLGMLDLIAPGDRVVVAKLWDQARTRGAAAGTVRLRRDPDRPGELYFFDVRERYGVVVVAFVEGESTSPVLGGASPSPAPRPRFARASKDETAVFMSVEPALSDMLGWTPHEMIGRRAIEFVHPDDHEIGIASWMQMLDKPGPGSRVRLRHKHRDGSWVWLEVTNFNRLHQPEHGDIVAEMLDISEEMAAHESLRQRERLLAQLTDAVPVGLFHADVSGQLMFSNRRLHTITGRTVADSLEEQFATVTVADRPMVDEAIGSAACGEASEVQFSIALEEAAERHYTMSVRPLVDDSGQVSGLIGCVEDVTAMIRSRRELELKAASDPLTGCLNRESILLALQEMLDGAGARSNDSTGTAVIFVDLDGFKSINDHLGHAAGDRLLVELTGRIRDATRARDLLGRLGGDEFVVICPEVGDPQSALALARALHERAFLSWEPDFGATRLRASMGVAWAAGPPATADELIKAADHAMYRSKRAGRAEPMLAD